MNVGRWGKPFHRRALSLGLVIGLSGAGAAAFPATGYAGTPKVGTVQGHVTTQGGLPLDGMCLHLFDTGYTNDEIQFAGSGTSAGQPGFFTQANVPVGRYIGLFFNCGANTGGNPDFNYVDVFYGDTFKPEKAMHITVSKGQTTDIGTSQIPLGGTVTGTVTDSTTGQPAWPLVVQAQIPGAASYNAGQAILTVCAGTDGSYSISGVPTTGVKIVFAPNNWLCPDSDGVFVQPFSQAVYPNRVKPPSDGTKSGVDGSVTENGSGFRPAGNRVAA